MAELELTRSRVGALPCLFLPHLPGSQATAELDDILGRCALVFWEGDITLLHTDRKNALQAFEPVGTLERGTLIVVVIEPG